MNIFNFISLLGGLAMFLYAGATILGGDTVIGDNCVIGGSVWLTHSVPVGETITIRVERAAL